MLYNTNIYKFYILWILYNTNIHTNIMLWILYNTNIHTNSIYYIIDTVCYKYTHKHASADARQVLIISTATNYFLNLSQNYLIPVKNITVYVGNPRDFSDAGNRCNIFIISTYILNMHFIHVSWYLRVHVTSSDSLPLS